MEYIVYSLLMTVLAFSFSAHSKMTEIKTVTTTTTTTTTKAVGTAESLDKNFQTMDLKQFDNLHDQSTGGINVKANLNCKSSSGTEYKSGDVGYDQCLRASGKSSQFQNNEQKATNDMELNFEK